MGQTQVQWEQKWEQRNRRMLQFIADYYPDTRQNEALRNLWKLQDAPLDSCELETLNGLLAVIEAVDHQRGIDRKRADTIDPDGVDSAYFKEDVLPPVIQLYLSCSAVQSRNVTSFLIVTALDTELYPLRREAESPSLIQTGNKRVDQGLAMHVGSGLTFVIVGILIQLLLAIFAFAVGWSWIGFALVAYTLYGAVLFVWRRRKVRALLIEMGLKLAGFVSALSLIRNEITSRVYNTEAVIRRLKALETDGVYIPSYVFSLLDLELYRGTVRGGSVA
jgi:hypothetical protein